jgi:hypothetical protein
MKISASVINRDHHLRLTFMSSTRPCGGKSGDVDLTAQARKCPAYSYSVPAISDDSLQQSCFGHFDYYVCARKLTGQRGTLYRLSSESIIGQTSAVEALSNYQREQNSRL